MLTRPAAPPDGTFRYGPEPEHVVDVRLPAGPDVRRRSPAVVVVHGGFWTAAWDRAHAGPLSEGLVQAGYVVATVEYRRVGQPGGGWPGTFDDTARVTDALPTLLAPHADIGSIVLVGHSAGAHLALWAAARHRLPAGSRWHRAAPLPIRGVVSLAGVTDLVEAARLGLGDGAAVALVGGGLRRQADRYASTSPVALVPLGTCVTLVHGDADPHVPVELSRRYRDLAVSAGDEVALIELPGVGHFELIDPRSAAWPAVVEAVLAVLR